MAYFASGGEGRYPLFRGTQIEDHELFEYTEMNTLKKLVRERARPFFFSARKTLVLFLVGY